MVSKPISLLERHRSRIVFILSLLALAALFFVLAVFAGRKLLISGHLWPPDLLFGMDIDRNIRNLSARGFNERSNVHPLFAPLFKPFGLLIQKAGITPGTSAIMVNAGAGAIGLLLTAWYLRLRRVSRLDAWVLTFLMAGSATWIGQSALPGTFIFSLCFIALSHILLVWGLRRPEGGLSPAARWGREALWFIVGVINYGITVSNGFMSFLAYGLSRRGARGWLRACLYGFAVLATGLLLSVLAGSALTIWAESQWFGNEAFKAKHPFLISLFTSVFWSVVAPIPQLVHTTDARGWLIAAFLKWDYSVRGWILALAWLGIMLAGLNALWRDRDRDSQRLSLALAGCLAFHVILHSYYYVAFEGTFLDSSHSLFLVIGLLTPLMIRLKQWPDKLQWIFRSLIFILALNLAINHVHLLLELRRLLPLPPGYH